MAKPAKPEPKPPAPDPEKKPGPLATKLFEHLGRMDKRLEKIERQLEGRKRRSSRAEDEDEERSIFDPRDEEE